MVNEIFFKKYGKHLIFQKLNEYDEETQQKYKEMVRFIPSKEEAAFTIEYDFYDEGVFKTKTFPFNIETDVNNSIFNRIFYADNEYDAVEIYKDCLSYILEDCINTNIMEDEGILLGKASFYLAIAYAKYIVIPIWQKAAEKYEKEHGEKYISEGSYYCK